MVNNQCYVCVYVSMMVNNTIIYSARSVEPTFKVTRQSIGSIYVICFRHEMTLHQRDLCASADLNQKHGPLNSNLSPI